MQRVKYGGPKNWPEGVGPDRSGGPDRYNELAEEQKELSKQDDGVFVHGMHR